MPVFRRLPLAFPMDDVIISPHNGADRMTSKKADDTVAVAALLYVAFFESDVHSFSDIYWGYLARHGLGPTLKSSMSSEGV